MLLDFSILLGCSESCNLSRLGGFLFQFSIVSNFLVSIHVPFFCLCILCPPGRLELNLDTLLKPTLLITRTKVT
ncbi:hypothetical protein BDW75DRAFT_124046 [Aspergillus navahoensis]